MSEPISCRDCGSIDVTYSQGRGGTFRSCDGCGAISRVQQFEPPPRRTRLIWAAVDFDNTIAYSMWTPENPSFEIGDPVPGSWSKCMELDRAGYKIIIHTARPWSDYELIEAWLDHHGYPWRRIECGKLLAEIYVDDRARHADAESWLP